RSEEVGGHHHRQGRADPDHGAVVAMLDTHHQVRARAIGHEPGDSLLQLARRDLAGAAAAARIPGEPKRIRTSHVVKSSPPPEHARDRPSPACPEAAWARVTPAPEASGCLVASVPVAADPARLRDKRGGPGEHEACPGPGPRPASDSLKRDPARTSAGVLARRAWTRAPGSRHRAAMLGQLLLTDNGGLTWHAVTSCN